MFGHLLSLNPNTVRWTARMRREEGRILLRAHTMTWPWTRGKHERIASFRLAQLADYLEVRLRGGAHLEKFAETSSRFPFWSAGRGIAEITMAWSWLLLSCFSCGILSWLAATLAALFVIDPSISSLAERAAQVETLRGIALPTPKELAGTGFLFRLGCSALLAFPIAFFLASLTSLSQLVGELWTPVSRASWTVPVFEAILLLLGLAPLIPAPSAVAMAILVPLAAHAGYGWIWGRKKERRRPLTSGRPRPAAALAGLVLGGVLLAALVPLPRSGEKMTGGLAEFRDRWLLSNSPGRAIARFYYRHTLYSAEPLKEAYDPSPRGYDRQVRTAHVVGSDAKIEETLRKSGFVLDPDRERALRLCDLLVIVGTDVPAGYDARAVALPPGSTEGQIRERLGKAGRASFRGQGLRELTQLGWWSVFFVGPLAAFALPVSMFLPLVSLLFRRVRPKTALVVLGIAGIASTIGILGLTSSMHEALSAVRRTDPSVSGSAVALVPPLSHADAGVRFEAAYRLYGCVQVPDNRPRELLAPLLAAVRDPDLRVRLWACGALGKYGDAAALAALLSAMADPEMFVRYRAAGALGDLADELRSQISAARRRLAEEEAAEKGASSRELAEAHAANARELRDRIAEFQRGLSEVRERSVDPLVRMAREDEWYCGSYALGALRRIRPGAY